MVTRWDPVGEMLSLQEAMNQLLSTSVLRPTGVAGGRQTSFPFDLYETSDDLILRAAIPGADPSNLDVSIQDGVLLLKGYRVLYSGDEERQYTWHMRGLSEGEFQFQVALPTRVQTEAAHASYENGLLTIQLPKVEDVKPRRIAISTGAGQQAIAAGAA
jgi:HSP20 family protein